jgi:DNA-binding transcriptional ArsR family regulator
VDQGDNTLERYRLHADVCKVLTDPKRLMLLDTLRGGDRTVGELAAAIGVTLPNASQHLGVLRSAGLVDGTRTGTIVSYRISEPAIADACDIIRGIVTRRLARAVPAGANRAAELVPPGAVGEAGSPVQLQAKP